MRARVLLGLAALVVAIPIAVGLFLIVVWLVLSTLVLLFGLATTESADAAERHWLPPVSGEPTRLFHLGPDPFLRGQHRGVDLAAHREPVRAACAGRVVFAGRVAGAGTVSVRCGAWRVSYAPLTRVAVREGERIGAGARLGRSAAVGIHFGVRREGRRFGYVDPLRFLAARRSPPPILVPPPEGRPRPGPRSRPEPPRPARPRAARARPPRSPRGRSGSAWCSCWRASCGTGRLRLPHRRQGRASRRSSSAPG